MKKKKDAFELVPPYRTRRKGPPAPPDPVYKLGKKKAQLTTCINLLQSVQASAAGYRQNLDIILAIEKLIPRLKEWRKDLDL